MPFMREYLSWLHARFARARHDARALLQRHRRIVLGVAVLSSLVFLYGTVQVVGLARDVFTGLPDRQQLRDMGRMAQATTLYDETDQPVFSISKEERIEVPLDRVSPRVVQALIAIEDQRFYQHSGIDYIRVVGAAWHNLRARRAVQGASTVTQQLARQVFFSSDKTLRRKLREMVMAARIERLFTKREILELYLNKVYFGDGLYGVEAASRGYFNRSATELTVSQAALLAGLVKSPSTYAPTVNPRRAVSRRNLVLKQMLATKVISTADFEQAKAETLVLNDGLRRDEGWGQHFKEQVRRELVARFGTEMVYEGGLKVYTTINPEMQRAAEASVTATLAEIEKKREAEARRDARVKKASAKAPSPPPPASPPLEAALVAIEPDTGRVQAMVGGRDFGSHGFNRAVQARRQPGSAFKPLVFAAALEAGFTPATLLDNLDAPIATPEGDWVPDDEHWDGKPITVRTALRMSSNRAAVHVLQRVGIARAVEYARKVGLGDVPSVPSLALGSGEVTLLTLAAAYVPFASGGETRPPVLIRRVENRDGTVLYSAAPHSERVLSETTAFLMSQMMADVINAGTAYRARSMGFTLPAAGKTGTTNDFGDAWFVGYTPRLLAAVWVGFDQPHMILRNGFAGDLAVPLWARFMRVATKGHPPDWYAPPRSVSSARVCRLSGQLAGPGCEHVTVLGDDGVFQIRSTVYTEYFLRGSEPKDYCQLHRDLSLYQRVAGGLDAPPDAAIGSSGSGELPGAPGAESAKEASAEAKPKKSFWKKVFGFLGGGDKDDKKDKKNDKKEKKDKKDDKKKDEPGSGGGSGKEP